MNMLDNRNEEIKILQKKLKLYFLSGIFFFTFLACALYLLFRSGFFIGVAFALKPERDFIDLFSNISLVALIISIIFFVMALLVKRK